MNRNNWRESLVRNRNVPISSQNNRYSQTLTGLSKDADENLDLFFKNRLTVSVVSSDESSDVSAKLGRLSIGSLKHVKSELDGLLSSTEGGKHDYDWLLTPPETPVSPSTNGNEVQAPAAVQRSRSLSRSASTTRKSRLSVSQSESSNSSRPARSSSVTRSSISSSQYSNYSANKSSSILNTSSASVSSYTRPSSPVTRSPSITRPLTPSGRPSPSRSSTPSRTRPAPTSSVVDKARPSQTSRPSTPTSRQQILGNLSSGAIRSGSCPSTPTRRNPVPSLTPALGSLISTGRVSNGRASSSSSRPSSPGRISSAPSRPSSPGRISSTASRPSSPGPRVRPPQQSIIPPDFPSDTPPNLRTALPDRPLSAGRSRPGVSVTTKTPETTGPVNVARRHSSPITTRGRITEPPVKGRLYSNGHVADVPEPRRVSHPPELGMWKPVRSASTENNGFGRNISKKSLDMAIRHMDIRNGNRPLSGSLFPQSIRAAIPRSQSIRSSASEPINNMNTDFSDYRSCNSSTAESGIDAREGRYSARLSEIDLYESSRYDTILLKEDLKDANWLHSFDDKSDQESIFGNGFESLPEPFGPL